MNTVQDKTDYQISLLGFQALRQELGVVGFIRFMQQFDAGRGNYTEERQEWQQPYTVDSLVEAIRKRKT